MNSYNFSKELSELPIYPHLDEICRTLKESTGRFLVLTAETAAGKSTGVPCALLENFPGKIYMLEPRRLAVFSIANRISELLNEDTGKTAGYRMQLENKLSKETRLEIITEAILTRQLQEDPLLEGVSVVVLDEFHERSIHSDLALAFLKEAMQIRDDLYVIVMSATMNTKKVSEYLGDEKNPCPVLNIAGRKFPVEIEYKNSSIEKAVLDEVRLLQNQKLTEGKTILAFLPGLGEIKRCAENLKDTLESEENIQIFLLHSSIEIEEQKKILKPVPQGIIRIVISSSIAETSITVPGVYVVIDSGLSRFNRLNVSLRMEKLVTEPESQFSAEQRAGRAGRLGNGKCIRLWDKNEIRPLMNDPEILRTDLTALVLECVQRQVYRPEDLSWLDMPNKASWNEALKLLELLGCVKDKKITELGKAVTKSGISPRLGCVAFSGQFETVLKFSNYAKSAPDIQRKFIANLKHRTVLTGFRGISCENALLAGFPDRLCHLEKGEYKFPSGRVARLSKNHSEKLAVLPEWIIAPEVDAGDSEGKIYSFEAVDFSKIKSWIESRTTTEIRTYFENNKIQKIENICYGKIILSSKKLTISSEDYGNALCNEIKSKGIKILPLDEKTENFLMRAAFFNQQNGTENKKTNPEYLKTVPEEWLLPFLGGKNTVTEKIVFDALHWFLNGNEIDRNVPEFIILENGKKRRLIYEKQTLSEDHTKSVIRPVLEVIIQQIFGCFKTPAVMKMPVLLKLLSPARRPLQITDDLANFWNGTWPEICKEMKGRYPKHNWDYRIAEKE